MSQLEISIWAAMAGVLLTFMVAALLEALRHSQLASWRAVAFVTTTGASAILMSGLPEQLLGLTNSHRWLPAKVAMGPLSGALALLYLGVWLGGIAQDRWLKPIIHWGALAQCLAAAVLAALAVQSKYSPYELLLAAAFVNAISVMLAMFAALRGTWLGDPLGWGMVAACLCLATMVAGLYTKGLDVVSSLWIWGITAIATVAYFLITLSLTQKRNRQLRRLVQMSQGYSTIDTVTGLPIGANLLSKVDDVMWRSLQHGNESAVIAVWLDNLYELSDTVDHAIEHEIRQVMAARVRRTVGFRYVLGLQQARCFILAFAHLPERNLPQAKVYQLRKQLGRAIRVGTMQGQSAHYLPRVGLGLLFVPLDNPLTPLQVMDQAQALAQEALGTANEVMIRDVRPVPPATQATG